ncbi:MAG: chemotaxis protein CheX [Oligoflexia bacterium]|nr:chemotaxis protein CheX [Oligoflexia bacterium]
MRFLVIDDEEDIVDTIRLWFEEAEYGEIDTANSIKDAKEKLLNGNYDIVVTDYIFPDSKESGADLARFCRINEELRSIYIVIMSGQVDSKSAIHYGRTRFLSKPFNQEDFDKTIRETIEFQKEKNRKIHLDLRFLRKISETTKEVLGNFTEDIGEQSGPVTQESRSIIKSDISSLMSIDCEKFRGSMYISFERDCILQIASKMLFEDFKDINSDVVEATGEIINMIVGNLKGKLPDYKFVMSAPSVIYGQDYKIQHLDGSTFVDIKFKTKAGKFQIDLKLLPPNR